MNREEFVALPLSLALGALWDILGERGRESLGRIEAPRMPLPPKFDRRIYRKGGHQWASETDLNGLRFWRDMAAKGAAGGGEYVEKNKKSAAELDRWIGWRQCCPAEPWSGLRGDETVMAAAPSAKPRIHPKNDAGAAQGTEQTAPAGAAVDLETFEY